jgi:hypothetical protein
MGAGETNPNAFCGQSVHTHCSKNSSIVLHIEIRLSAGSQQWNAIPKMSGVRQSLLFGPRKAEVREQCRPRHAALAVSARATLHSSRPISGRRGASGQGWIAGSQVSEGGRFPQAAQPRHYRGQHQNRLHRSEIATAKFDLWSTADMRFPRLTFLATELRRVRSVTDDREPRMSRRRKLDLSKVKI